MREYNDTARRLLYALLPALALIGACATADRPPPARTPAAETAAPPAPFYRDTTGTTAGATVPLRDDAPLRYTVKKGDTLWDIAGYFLDDPWYWPELWYANPEIRNPHLIYPGDVLELVWVNGRPQLRRARGERLSPRVRELPLDAAIHTIPLDAVRQFLTGPRLVTPEELDAAPYLVEFLDGHLVGGVGNEIYIRRADPARGDTYAVVRPGEVYRDPDDGDILGYEAIPVASAEILRFGDISTGTLTRAFREALVGDRLLPVEDAQTLASNFHPHAPGREVDGRIISVYDGVSEIGQYEIVAVNRGERHGLERGHVLDIFQIGRQARDPVTGKSVTLPPLKAGTLMIFETGERMAFGLVMRATRAIHVLDSVRNPQGS